MKKLISVLTGLTLVSSSVVPVVSCKKNDNSENINNYWGIRKQISEKYNIALSDFTLDWINSNKTLKFRPIVGTDLYNNHKNIPDTFNINDGFNSVGKNKKLSEIKNVLGPITKKHIQIPYDETTTTKWNNAKDDKKIKAHDYMVEGYFEVLELLLGAKFDRSLYYGEYKDQTNASNKAQKGIFTVTNKKDKKDFVELPVNVHAVSINNFYDTDKRAGKIYLPKELSQPTSDFFETQNAMGLGGPFQGETNKMTNVDWPGEVLGYYSTDMANLYADMSSKLFIDSPTNYLSANNIKINNNEFSISFNVKNAYNINDENSFYNKVGLSAGDKNNNIFTVNYNCTTEIPDGYDMVPKYVLKKGESLTQDKFDMGAMKISDKSDDSHVQINTDVFIDSSDNEEIKEQTLISNVFTMKNFTVDKNLSDDKIKELFINDFNKETGSHYKWDNYLYAELNVFRQEDSIVLRPRPGSRVFSHSLSESMATNVPVLGKIHILTIHDHTVASYAFNINYNK